jgi:hypothetical protein
MRRRSPWALAAIGVLALVFLLAAVAGAIALAQPTSKTSTTYSSYSASVVPVLNVSLRPNQLYPTTNVTDPPAIFRNITSGLALSVAFYFSSSEPMVVTGGIAAEATFYSGTTPSWSKQMETVSESLDFNASAESAWLDVPLDLGAILNTSATIDGELNVTPGAGSLVVNTSMVFVVPGAVAENNSSIGLSFVYPSTGSGQPIVPWTYSSILLDRPLPGTSFADIATQHRTSLPSEDREGTVYLAVAMIALVAAGALSWRYVSRHRPTALERFLSENEENVVRVRADSRPSGHAVAVESVGELVKLANLSGEPIYLFESSRGAVLYSIQGDTTFAFSIPSEGRSEEETS